MPSGNHREAQRYRRRFAPAITLGYTFTGGMIFFTLIGYAIDKKRGKGSTWTLVGMFMGFFYGMYEVWKVIRAINEEDAAGKR